MAAFLAHRNHASNKNNSNNSISNRQIISARSFDWWPIGALPAARHKNARHKCARQNRQNDAIRPDETGRWTQTKRKQRRRKKHISVLAACVLRNPTLLALVVIIPALLLLLLSVRTVVSFRRLRSFLLRRPRPRRQANYFTGHSSFLHGADREKNWRQ